MSREPYREGTKTCKCGSNDTAPIGEDGFSEKWDCKACGDKWWTASRPWIYPPPPQKEYKTCAAIHSSMTVGEHCPNCGAYRPTEANTIETVWTSYLCPHENEMIFGTKTEDGKVKRNAAICADYRVGKSHTIIAREHGISRSRVAQIIEKGKRSEIEQCGQ